MKSLLVLAVLLTAGMVWAQEQLPDAPSQGLKLAQSSKVGDLQERPSAAAKGVQFGRVADGAFWAVHGVMFSSTISTTELTARCMQSGACSAVPDPLRSRKALYGIGIPANIGVTYLGYYLKSRGHRWWFVPAAVVTAGSIVYGVHASRYIH